MTNRQQAIRRDAKILRQFTEVYCRQNDRTSALCPDCRELLAYSIRRRRACPYDPKPACRHCKTHCYAPAYRDRIRKVMRAGGIQYVKSGLWARLGPAARRFLSAITPTSHKKGTVQ